MLTNCYKQILLVLSIKYCAFGYVEYKSSLTFVIDDTASMTDDIDQVKIDTNAIFDAVLKSNASQIENFILITFNDDIYDPPVKTGVILRANTKERHVFKEALSAVYAHNDGNPDCPEFSMSGIKRALEESRPGSYIYVFTDATAKDFHLIEEVKSIAVSKQSQVVFVLTGQCAEPESSIKYQVYEELATATSGVVFHLKKDEIGLVLKYVRKTLQGPRTTLARVSNPPSLHTFTWIADSKSKDYMVIITSSGYDKPYVDITGPNGNKTPKEKIIDTDQIVVYEVGVTIPGVYTITIDSKSKTRVLVTAGSEISFRHGFSIFRPSSINDTTTRPVPDVKSHLSIELIEGDIELKTTKIVDMHGNVLLEVPLKISNESAKFYVTEPFDPPKTMFQITIIGYDPVSKTNITRKGSQPIEIQKTLPGEIKLKTPSVVIDGEVKINAEYDKPLQLICNANGYPRPEIVWKNKDNGSIISKETGSVKELPYKYVSILFIEKVSENATYECEASNPSGSETKAVTVETYRKKYFNVVDSPKRTKIELGKEGRILCLVDAYPPTEITWYRNGRKLWPDGEIEISQNKSIIIIKHAKPSHRGKYLCDARNEYITKRMFKYVDVVGVEPPIIDKNVTDIAIKKNNSAVIECKILQGKPRPSINWFYGSTATSKVNPIETWNDQERIVVKNVGKNDSGTYWCQADNEVKKDNHHINLLVEYPPSITKDVSFIKAKANSTIFINCNVDGGPLPYVTWLKDDVKITNSDKIHILKNKTLKIAVNLSDNGNYTCKATNRLGVAVKTVKVDVYVPSNILTNPRMLIILVGSKLSLPCEAEGIPEVDIKWLYHSFNTSAPSNKTSIIRSKRDGSLYFKHIQLEEEGFYTCIANNFGGSMNITYEVQVLAPPIIKNIYKDKRIVAVEGDLVLGITCVASGNPKPNITWTKDGLNLALGSTFYVEDNTLIIRNVTKKSKGIYNCKAENFIGTSQEIYEVSVDQFPASHPPNIFINIEEGKPVEIKCPMSHKQGDLLRWYKDRVLIHTDRSEELTLSNPSVRDSGNYTCRVSDFFESVSANIRVNVGYKPTFTEKDKNMVTFSFEGPPVSLNCEASGVPEPHVTWYRNDEQLNLTKPILYFPTGVKIPGQYRCDVNNIFGTITKLFNATSKDCLVNIDKFTNVQPLLVRSDLTWPEFKRTKEFMIIPNREQFVLFCTSGFKMFPGQYIMPVFCDGGMNFMINGEIYDYSDLLCTEEVTHMVLRTGEKCLVGANTEMVKIIYDVWESEFTEVYDICLDNTNNVPLYAMHHLKSTLADDDYKTTWLASEQFRLDFEDVYDCESETQTYKISTRLGTRFHNTDQCCFFKRQLVNPRDVFPGVAQRSTYSYFNIVPQWSTCNADNWDDVEQRVRNLAKNRYKGILVWTGTAKEMFLPSAYTGTTNNSFTDQKTNHQPVPLFLWKVIQDPAAKSSLAIVQVNVPDLSPSEVSEYILCRDICDLTDWMKGTNWHNVTRGYTYCCLIEEFERTFGFDGVFMPDMREILALDSTVVPLPEHSLFFY